MNSIIDSIMMKNLNEVACTDADAFGKKAFNLAIMSCESIKVPNGFCVSDKMLRSIFDPIEQGYINTKLLEYIYENSISLFGDWENNSKIAVRSSASVEDTTAASFAGIFRSEINISNKMQLYDALRLCWESKYSERVYKYASKFNKDISNMSLGIIVQEMIIGDFSGVVFTKNPMCPETNRMLIETQWGLCSSVVEGIIDPHRLEIDCSNYQGDVIDFADEYFSREILVELINTSKQIERMFSCPQDIEWTVRGSELFILQTRPITSCLCVK